MTFIDDNGNQLQFNGEFAMTKQAVSFFNGSIKGDVSQTFQVDNNSVNRDVLGYFGPQMTSQVAWTKQAFNRIRNGNVIDRGYIVIQNDDGKKLSCFYVSGNSNWVQLIQGLITELDYTGVTNGTDYRVKINATNINTLFTATTGVIFPLVDFAWNYDKGNNNWYASILYDEGGNEFSEFYPCMYVSTILNEIAKQNGLKLAGTLFSDKLFNSIVITPKSGLITRDYVNITSANGSAYTLSTVGGGTTNLYNTFTDVTDVQNQMTSSTYTANKNTLLNITLIITQSSAAALQTISTFIRKNGSNVLTALSGPAGVYTITTYYVQTNVVSGDVIEVYSFKSGGGAASITCNLKIVVPTVISILDTIGPNDFLPDIKSIDFFKYYIQKFGCVVTFNEISKTITANIIEKIKTESAYDWSAYFLGSNNQYTVNQAQNNYIRLPDVDDYVIKRYNKNNEVGYGEGNIETGNTLKKSNDLFTSIFAASGFDSEVSGTWLSNVPLITLNDSSFVEYTSITDPGSPVSDYNLSSSIVYRSGEIFRIVDDSKGDLGYFVGTFNTASIIRMNQVFSGTSTGRIYRQAVTFNNTTSRELVCVQSTIANISGDSTFSLYDDTAGYLTYSSKTVCAIANFSKSKTGKNIDSIKDNLAFDNINNDAFTDPTIKQLYFNKISKFLQNPNIRAKMLLPESVYQSFAFDQFIYIKSERLTGYFFVDSINNYIDANTPTEVNLYML